MDFGLRGRFWIGENREGWNRREFLTNLAVAGSAALLGLHADAFAAE
ncbi:MAG: twin-arginine translocation signal domain-containing protein, partial [Candidatus Binatia bacterium]